MSGVGVVVVDVAAAIDSSAACVSWFVAVAHAPTENHHSDNFDDSDEHAPAAVDADIVAIVLAYAANAIAVAVCVAVAVVSSSGKGKRRKLQRVPAQCLLTFVTSSFS